MPTTVLIFPFATVTMISVGEDARRRPNIDELLDRAVRAINDGDRATANELAEQVLEVDQGNVDAEELLFAAQPHGELRRLTIMFVDLVDSTELSTRIEPETYRTVVSRYRDEVTKYVNRYGGHIGNTKGDGLLAIFGHPRAHEDDARRAVQAGLDIIREVVALSARIRRRFGFDIAARVGVHRGLVYLDIAQDDVYGLAANMAARVCSIADPGTARVSEAIERLVHDHFELEEQSPAMVKGVDVPVRSYRVVAERPQSLDAHGPLVGRDREAKRVRDLWSQAAAGTVDTALAICGEAGIGKSRLAFVAVQAAQREHATVLQLQGSPLHTDVGLHPVRELLERACGITRTSNAADRLRLLRDELRKRNVDVELLVPLLAPVLGIPIAAGYTPVAASGSKLSAHIVDALRTYLVARIGAGPALLLAEDVHWFDAATAEVVASLHPADPGRLAVFMTTRRSAALPKLAHLDVIELDPLDRASTDELIAVLDPQMSDDAREAVRQRCGGIPLYIEEVVAKAKESQSGGQDSATVPDTLYEALFARLRASASSARVVEVAATVGSRFDTGLLQAILGTKADDLDRILDELCSAGVFVRVDAGTWRFRHELLREVAAEIPPPSVRKALHGSVADALTALVTRGDPDWPSIAAHFEIAERYVEAASAYQMASTTARFRGALEEAKGYLSRALAQLERVAPDGQRDRVETNLRLRRGFLVSAALGPVSEEASSDFERCLQLASADPESDELFATLMATFTYYVTRGDLVRAQRIVDSLRIGVDSGREWWRAENVGGAGTLSFFRGDFDTASEQLESASELVAARDRGDVEAMWFTPHDPVVLSLCSLAVTRMVRCDTAGARKAIAHAAEWAEALGFPQGPFSACYVRYIEMWLFLEWGEIGAAARSAADMAARADTHGFDQWIALGATFVHLTAAVTAVADGRPDAPEVTTGVAILSGWTTAARMVEARVWLPSFDGHLVRLLIARGEFDPAAAQVAAGLRLADETGMHYYDSELIRMRAQTASDAAGRNADLDAAFALALTQGAHLYALRAALDDHDARGAAARARLTAAVAAVHPEYESPELTRARSLLA